MKMTDAERILATIADHWLLADDAMNAAESTEMRAVYRVVRARMYDLLTEACEYDEGMADALLEEAANRFVERDAQKLNSAALYGSTCYD